jgi:hypothetical protein
LTAAFLSQNLDEAFGLHDIFGGLASVRAFTPPIRNYQFMDGEPFGATTQNNFRVASDFFMRTMFFQ